MNVSTQNFFQDLELQLRESRQAFLKTYSFDEENDLRSEQDALTILHFLKKVHELAVDFSKHVPSLLQNFEHEFVPLKEFQQREGILEWIFLDDFLIPNQKRFPFLNSEDQFDSSLLDQHLVHISHWIEQKKSLHSTTQKNILENPNSYSLESHLECQCHKCLGDYRNKIRDYFYQECLQLVQHTHRQVSDIFLFTHADHDQIEHIRSLYHQLQKSLNQLFHQARFRLRRGILNKIEQQIKTAIKEKFDEKSDLHKKFRAFIFPSFKQYLVEESLHHDFLKKEEYDRFFQQLGIHLWREEHYLKREFLSLVRSVLRLKRKDISASILQEYLGQFWLHSETRRIKRRIIYHCGPTNSGKTYHAIEALSQSKKGCYLAPLRLLASEWFDTMNAQQIKTNLLTGEEIIEIPGATHYSSTIEMAKLKEEYDCCVIDEIQMITDTQRGWAWTRAFVNIHATEVHLCGDGSVTELIQTMCKLTGDELEIKNYERLTSLEVLSEPLTLGELQKHDALIVFSRRNALKYKADLEKLGFKVSIVYGRLGPEVRREQARKFDAGETDIMVSTDAIAMGMNLPIQRIIFSTLSKVVDEKEFQITPSEIKQIAGRAGRYKRFPHGQVSCLARVEKGLHIISKALQVHLPQNEKAMVGPDLEIYTQVNQALTSNNLPILDLSEFLRLFNTMNFIAPFYCVDLKEMIELTEMAEQSNEKYKTLTPSEFFGFACAPVNLGLTEHVQYYVYILNNFIRGKSISNDLIQVESDNIDYLETSIKCIELYQWLARHFKNKHFSFDEQSLLENKSQAIERLNQLLSHRLIPNCSSCGKRLDLNTKFNICEECFQSKKFYRQRRPYQKSNQSSSYQKDSSYHSTHKQKSSNNHHDRKNNSSSKRFRKKNYS